MLLPINENARSPLREANLIDSIQRLGLYHHFEHEIGELLRQIHNNYVENGTITLNEDLHSIALVFRLLRQQGYHILTVILPDQKSDHDRRSSVPTPVKRRRLCTCRCSDAQVTPSAGPRSLMTLMTIKWLTENGWKTMMNSKCSSFQWSGVTIREDVFKKFKNEQGNFKETLIGDVEGMISLYEATHMRIHGEDILDEALSFTSLNLKMMATQLNPSLATKVNHSLKRPLFKNLPRLVARHYISNYEKDSSHDATLLLLAKLDFNLLQKQHQKEIGNIS
ncbi:(-)-germacrene D synthase-like protein, partial [Trifolium pratense]